MASIESLNGVYEITQTSETDDPVVRERVRAASLYDYTDTRAVLLNGILAGVNEGGFVWVFRIAEASDGNLHLTGFVDATFMREGSMLFSKDGNSAEDRQGYEGSLTLVESGGEIRLSGRIEHGVLRFNVVAKRVGTL